MPLQEKHQGDALCRDDRSFRPAATNATALEVLRRQLLGEINSSQEFACRKSIEVLDEAQKAPRTLALFPDDRYKAIVDDETVVRLKLSRLRL